MNSDGNFGSFSKCGIAFSFINCARKQTITQILARTIINESLWPTCTCGLFTCIYIHHVYSCSKLTPSVEIKEFISGMVMT